MRNGTYNLRYHVTTCNLLLRFYPITFLVHSAFPAVCRAILSRGRLGAHVHTDYHSRATLHALTRER